MNYFSKLYTRWQHFLHNETLKQKVYSIVFESDTPKGRLFDIILISSIIVSVLMVILESMHLFSPTAYWVLRLLEYLLTLFFTIEYLARIYCLKNPRKYIFSFFGLVDLLANPAGLPELLPEGSTLPAGHPGLPAHPDIPHFQTVLFHQ